MRTDLGSIRRALAGRAHRPASLHGGERFAAVAAILRERADDTEVLLIRRTQHARDPWSGHMAFPGGRKDPTDEDLLGTAIRETHEEVGLSLDATRDLVGRLDDLPAVARGRRVGMIITPFVFSVTGDPELVPNASEVAEVVWAPLGALGRGERDTTFTYTFDGRTIPLPAFDVDGRVVWGLTHRMLLGLFEALDVEKGARYSPSW